MRRQLDRRFADRAVISCRTAAGPLSPPPRPYSRGDGRMSAPKRIRKPPDDERIAALQDSEVHGIERDALLSHLADDQVGDYPVFADTAEVLRGRSRVGFLRPEIIGEAGAEQRFRQTVPPARDMPLRRYSRGHWGTPRQSRRISQCTLPTGSRCRTQRLARPRRLRASHTRRKRTPGIADWDARLIRKWGIAVSQAGGSSRPLATTLKVARTGGFDSGRRTS
jgi:hypothetical protein